MKSRFRVQLLKQILLLFGIGILLGVGKVEFFMRYVNVDLINRTRIISYISLFISSIFFYIVVVLAIIASYYSLEFQKLGTNYNFESFFLTIRYFIWALIINELVKFLITIYTFRTNRIISNEVDLNIALSNNELWIFLITFSDVFFILIGGLVFSLMLKRDSKELNYFQAIIASLPLFLSFLIFRFT